jgi:hypothetical protein
MSCCQHKFIQKKKTPVMGFFHKRARTHCSIQTVGFIGKEGLCKGRGNLSIVVCPLYIARGSQRTGSCVLVQVLGNETLLSWTNSKTRTLLGIVKVFWHTCWDTKVSMGAHLS